LGKSYPGFGPVGPWIVTPDEFSDRRDLHLETRVNGEVMQSASTLGMVRPVDALISRLSEITPLLAGDIVFSGTPAGIGMTRTPSRFLSIGDVVETTISGIGTLRNEVVA
jgi:2-keto-4-pentenoate hydratase/2-oxohepta-3-ene-1,7-dioic acid hydratase in catechol pathway